MNDRWLSAEEIARYLGVSKDTIYAWLGKRRMPAHRVGRLWKFKRAEIDDWVHDGGAAAVLAPLRPARRSTGRATKRGTGGPL